MQIKLGEHDLRLMAERAVWWPEQQALLLADVHLGKDQVFRRQGLAVPAGVLQTDLGNISALLAKTQARRLIILGDWVHAPPAAGDDWSEQVAVWRSQHLELTIDLIVGNHDRQLDHWLPRWGMSARTEPWMFGGLALCHAWHPRLDTPGLSGHLHPGAVLGNGRDRLRLPAFLLSDRHLVLPAFGRFTGLDDQPDFPAQRRFVIAGRKVMEIA
ncbi:MAG: ligase-associated DNA damage response endonuclease PdeM [Wenzhouxiangellaceae bacterium]|nr:MAG: ligase-associated DNA damage response endonuclease PdeM [Wenzhouxiangellaceae bacterium]